jgi:site-specific recombinase XerD
MAKVKVLRGTKGTALEQLVEDFLASARARGLSPRTIDGAYSFILKSVFLPFCAREGITKPEQLNNRLMDRFSTELQATPGKRGEILSKSTIAAYMRTVNIFLKWGADQGEPVKAKGQVPKIPKKLVEVLSRQDIRHLEDAAQTERDKLIIRVLADTGVRVGELVRLTSSDLVIQNRDRYLHVHGKGAKDRMVPIKPELFMRLARYAERGRPAGTRSNRIFIGLRKRRYGEYEPLTESGVLQVVETATIAADISKRVYPHLFRHSYGTFMLSQGMNPILLAQIMGHSSLAMIQNVYAHLTPSDAYEAMLRALEDQ